MLIALCFFLGVESVYNFRSDSNDHSDDGGPSSQHSLHSGQLEPIQPIAIVNSAGVKTSTIIDGYERLRQNIEKWAV